MFTGVLKKVWGNKTKSAPGAGRSRNKAPGWASLGRAFHSWGAKHWEGCLPVTNATRLTTLARVGEFCIAWPCLQSESEAFWITPVPIPTHSKNWTAHCMHKSFQFPHTLYKSRHAYPWNTAQNTVAVIRHVVAPMVFYSFQTDADKKVQ